MKPARALLLITASIAASACAARSPASRAATQRDAAVTVSGAAALNDLARARLLRASNHREEALEAARTAAEHAAFPERSAALALTGAVEAELDRLGDAEKHLCAALEPGDAWPGAGRAAADLGCVYLRLRREREGLAALARAAALLEREGDADGLARSLENEAAYFRWAGRAAEADAAAVRARAVRNSASAAR